MARNTPHPVQQYRGTTKQHNGYTGPEGELTVNTDTNSVHVHDGRTVGGHPLMTAKSHPVGEIFYFGGTTEPFNCLRANGGVAQAAQYPELYSVYGTLYNTSGEAAGTFRLPNIPDLVSGKVYAVIRAK